VRRHVGGQAAVQLSWPRLGTYVLHGSTTRSLTFLSASFSSESAAKNRLSLSLSLSFAHLIKCESSEAGERIERLGVQAAAVCQVARVCVRRSLCLLLLLVCVVCCPRWTEAAPQLRRRRSRSILSASAPSGGGGGSGGISILDRHGASGRAITGQRSAIAIARSSP
jgi:hypothetical protein